MHRSVVASKLENPCCYPLFLLAEKCDPTEIDRQLSEKLFPRQMIAKARSMVISADRGNRSDDM